MIHIDLTYEPINVNGLYKKLRSSKYGCIVVFCGIVREWTEEIQTKQIEYSAYEEMALKEIQRLADNIKEEAEVAIVIEHRLGLLELSEEAVFIGVAAEHREEAFNYCRQLIDQLKEKVPIWKKEIDSDRVRWGGIRDDFTEN